MSEDEFKNFDREDLILLIECQKERIGELLADRPQGEWKNHKDEHYCTNCGEVVIGDWYDEDDWYTYCPNCGAQMKGADDE